MTRWKLKSSPRANIWLLAGACLVLAAGVNLYVSVWRALPDNFGTVQDGLLYRSGQPKGWQLENVRRRYGIETIISFRRFDPNDVPDWLETERRFAGRHGVELITWPLSSRRPPDNEFLERFFEIVNDPRRQPILVHCAEGKHRTGFFCAAYRMVIDGWSIDKAFAEMQRYGFSPGERPALTEGLKKLDPNSCRAWPAE